MKKDIEWLVQMIDAERENLRQRIETGRGTPNENTFNEGRDRAFAYVLRMIQHLDGPEVLSWEWIHENKEMYLINDTSENAVPDYKLQNLLVPKQEITFYQVHDKLREESILSEKSFDYYWNCINDNVEIDEPGNLIVPKEELIMNKLETLTVPTDLGEWLQSRRIGDSGVYFSTIDALFHYWDYAPDTEVFNFISQNKKELIEVILGTRGYKIKVPLYHALIKGHELIGDGDEWTYKYWKFDLRDGRVFLSDRFSLNNWYLTKMSKEAWNELGINDSSADFVMVDD